MPAAALDGVRARRHRVYRRRGHARPARQLRHVRAGDRRGARRALPHAAADRGRAVLGRGGRHARGVRARARCSPRPIVLARVEGSVIVAHTPDELEPERRVGRDRHLRRRASRAPARDRGGARGAPAADGRDVRPAPAHVLRPAGRAALDARAPARAARGGRGRGRARPPLRRGARALEPAVFAESMLRGDRRGGRRGGRRLPLRTRSARATSACSSSSASTCGACRSSTTSRRATSATLLAVGDVAHAATLLGRPPEVEGIVVLGDQRGRLLGFPTANLETPPDLLVPALGIYAGCDARPPDRDLDRHESALRRHGAPGRGPPARLRRRPLRPAARLRALGAAAGRGRLRLGGGARRGDRPRRRADARGRAARLSDRKFAARGRLPGYGSPRAVPGTRRPRDRPLPRVRRDLLEARRRRHGQKNPGCPTCGYVGWIPVSLPREPRARRRSAAGRPLLPLQPLR